MELEQPLFGANYIKGKIRAQPNGGWVGEAKFKLHFKHGGAIEYGQAMQQAAALGIYILLLCIDLLINKCSFLSSSVNRNHPYGEAPPPYQPPSGPWASAPPPAYAAPNGGYYGWVPPTNVFPNAPPANSVFMADMPPPYPGLNSGAGGFYQPPPPPSGHGNNLFSFSVRSW